MRCSLLCLALLCAAVAGARVVAAPAPAPAQGVPFGAFGWTPLERYRNPFTLAFAAPRSRESLQRFLEEASLRRMRVVIDLSGSRRLIQNTDGSFNLELLTQQLERYAEFDFAPYVKDGTLLALLLFDEPHEAANWNEQAVSPAVLELAAEAGRRLFPSVPIGIGAPPSYLAGEAPYRHLEIALAQYHPNDGDAAKWLERETELAKQAGLDLILSLNALTGGTPTPVGAEPTPMTAEQLRRHGSILARARGASAFLLWQYDEEYFSRPDIAAVVEELARLARSPRVRPR